MRRFRLERVSATCEGDPACCFGVVTVCTTGAHNPKQDTEQIEGGTLAQGLVRYRIQTAGNYEMHPRKPHLGAALAVCDQFVPHFSREMAYMFRILSFQLCVCFYTAARVNVLLQFDIF